MSEFKPLELSGLFFRAAPRFRDDRGFFQELIRNSYIESFLPLMVQDNLSFSAGDVLRGMHFQENQWQILTILKGSILDITIDVSKNSPTFMRTCNLELSAEGTNQLIIPPNVAHGFCTLSDEVLLNYKSTRYYGETPQFGIAWNSEELVDMWPHKNWTISKRDNSFQTLQEYLRTN
jgi:dTDP-4-dehydrorhamnose 3,5-epimerase